MSRRIRRRRCRLPPRGGPDRPSVAGHVDRFPYILVGAFLAVVVGTGAFSSPRANVFGAPVQAVALAVQSAAFFPLGYAAVTRCGWGLSFAVGPTADSGPRRA